jgi:hypothetical protein
MSRILTRPAARCAAVAMALGIALVTACASAHGAAHAKRNNEDVPHDINIEVQNDLPVPTMLTVYVVEGGGGGIRRSLGVVPGDEVQTFTFRPLSFSQPYRLLAYQQLSRPIYSPMFTVGSSATGTVIWSMYNGIISFRQQDIVDTTYVGNKGPIRVGGTDSTAKPADTAAAPQDSLRDTTKTP